MWTLARCRHVGAPCQWSLDNQFSLPVRPQSATTASNPPSPPPSGLSLEPSRQGGRCVPRDGKGAPLGWHQPVWDSAGLCKQRRRQPCNSEPAVESEEDALVPCLAQPRPQPPRLMTPCVRGRLPSPGLLFPPPRPPSSSPAQILAHSTSPILPEGSVVQWLQAGPLDSAALCFIP